MTLESDPAEQVVIQRARQLREARLSRVRWSGPWLPTACVPEPAACLASAAGVAPGAGGARRRAAERARSRAGRPAAHREDPQAGPEPGRSRECSCQPGTGGDGPSAGSEAARAANRALGAPSRLIRLHGGQRARCRGVPLTARLPPLPRCPGRRASGMGCRGPIDGVRGSRTDLGTVSWYFTRSTAASAAKSRKFLSRSGTPPHPL
jgi:hypothetical protein